MNYSALKKNDIADGLGVRVSLFVSGCRNHCKGCFNEITWSFDAGKPYTKETEKEIIDALYSDRISGLSVLGGDPFEPENQHEVGNLMEKVKCLFPEKNIWIWSGYTFDEILARCTDDTKIILKNADILIDGRFEIDKRDITLNFRGSTNQRIWIKQNDEWTVKDD